MNEAEEEKREALAAMEAMNKEEKQEAVATTEAAHKAALQSTEREKEKYDGGPEGTASPAAG